jgi:hypothetical protein
MQVKSPVDCEFQEFIRFQIAGGGTPRITVREMVVFLRGGLG